MPASRFRKGLLELLDRLARVLQKADLTTLYLHSRPAAGGNAGLARVLEKADLTTLWWN
jgi:hypothetical protein